MLTRKRSTKVRPSISANASSTDELTRLHSMTMEERIKEALALADGFHGIIPPRKILWITRIG